MTCINIPLRHKEETGKAHILELEHVSADELESGTERETKIADYLARRGAPKK